MATKSKVAAKNKMTAIGRQLLVQKRKKWKKRNKRKNLKRVKNALARQLLVLRTWNDVLKNCYQSLDRLNRNFKNCAKLAFISTC